MFVSFIETLKEFNYSFVTTNQNTRKSLFYIYMVYGIYFGIGIYEYIKYLQTIYTNTPRD